MACTSPASPTWFGGVYRDIKDFFPNFAVDSEDYFQMYPEIRIPPDPLRARGARGIRAVDVKPLQSWYQRFEDFDSRRLDLRRREQCLEALDGIGDVYPVAAARHPRSRSPVSRAPTGRRRRRESTAAAATTA